MLSSSALLAQEPTTKFKYGTEPNGFRGIKWGDNRHSHKDIYNCDFGNGGIDAACVRAGDKMNIGTVPLEYINYHFYENHLCNVIVEYTGLANYYSLRKILQLQYGDVYEMDKSDLLFSKWEGKITVIMLVYMKQKKEGALRFESSKCTQYRNAKIKKESAGDF